MFKFERTTKEGVRIGTLTTAHGEIQTPFFMPVGTVGSVKATAPWELEEMGAQILLSNTYHLYLRPGEKLVQELGGLHQFMKWDKPILTDSGGYQVFSLARGNNHNKHVIPAQAGISKIPDQVRDDKLGLVKITEDGVEFKSHLDGSKHFFTPEKVIDIQLDLGVDILMPLDVCPSGKASEKEIKDAVELTIRWAKRAKAHFEKKTKVEKDRPLLHGIVQGGLDPKLRKYCAEKLMEIDFDGYSVGGLAVDLETRDMWEIVQLMGEILPENKQRYLMGVGTPDDIMTATRLGMDMFDCVLPTRLARHGNVYIKQIGQSASQPISYKLTNLLNSKFRNDRGVIDENCGCPACQEGRGFSRAYITHLLRSNEILGLRLTTLHNLWQYLELMRALRSQ